MTTDTRDTGHMWHPSAEQIEAARVLAEHGTMTRDELADAVPAMAYQEFCTPLKRLSRSVHGNDAGMSRGRVFMRETLVHLERRGLIRREQEQVIVSNRQLLKKWAELAELNDGAAS